VIKQIAQGLQKGTRRISCLVYTLYHNQKKKNYIPQIHLNLTILRSSPVYNPNYTRFVHLLTESRCVRM